MRIPPDNLWAHYFIVLWLLLLATALYLEVGP
jgi:hypothetical protein